MSLLDEIKKDRKEIKVPQRRCFRGPTANLSERNKEICRRYWSGEDKMPALAKEFGITVPAVSRTIIAVEEKLKKYQLTRQHYLDA